MSTKFLFLGCVAQTGKDTVARKIKALAEADGLTCHIDGFANTLRFQLTRLLVDQLGIDPFTEDPTEKAIIRPILVAYGEAMKKRWGELYWANAFYNRMDDVSADIIIAKDWRFDYELQPFKNEKHLAVVLDRIGTCPINDTEMKSYGTCLDVAHETYMDTHDFHHQDAIAESIYKKLKNL